MPVSDKGLRMIINQGEYTIGNRFKIAKELLRLRRALRKIEKVSDMFLKAPRNAMATLNVIWTTANKAMVGGKK